MKLRKAKNCCWQCKRRSPKCHFDCEAYKEFLIKDRAWKKKMQMDDEIDSIIIQNTLRINKKLENK